MTALGKAASLKTLRNLSVRFKNLSSSRSISKLNHPLISKGMTSPSIYAESLDERSGWTLLIGGTSGGDKLGEAQYTNDQASDASAETQLAVARGLPQSKA